MPPSPSFLAECAKCGERFPCRQVEHPAPPGKCNIGPWPPCPKCGHRRVYAVPKEATA